MDLCLTSPTQTRSASTPTLLPHGPVPHFSPLPQLSAQTRSASRDTKFCLVFNSGACYMPQRMLILHAAWIQGSGTYFFLKHLIFSLLLVYPIYQSYKRAIYQSYVCHFNHIYEPIYEHITDTHESMSVKRWHT